MRTAILILGMMVLIQSAALCSDCFPEYPFSASLAVTADVGESTDDGCDCSEFCMLGCCASIVTSAIATLDIPDSRQPVIRERVSTSPRSYISTTENNIWQPPRQ